MNPRFYPRDPRCLLCSVVGNGGTIWNQDWFWRLRGGGAPTEELGLEIYRAAPASAPHGPRLVARLGVRYISHEVVVSTWGPVQFDVVTSDLVTWRISRWPYDWCDLEVQITCPAPNTLVWDQIAFNRTQALQPLDLYCWFDPVGGERPFLVHGDESLIASFPDATVVLAGRGFGPRHDALHKAHAHYKYLPMTFALTVDARAPQTARALHAAYGDRTQFAKPTLDALKHAPDPPDPSYTELWTALWDQTRASLVSLPDGSLVARTSRTSSSPISAVACLATAVALKCQERDEEAQTLARAILLRQDKESGFLPAFWGSLPEDTLPQPAPPWLPWLVVESGLADRDQAAWCASLGRHMNAWLAHSTTADPVEACQLALGARFVAELARKLGQPEDAARWNEVCRRTAAAALPEEPPIQEKTSLITDLAWFVLADTANQIGSDWLCRRINEGQALDPLMAWGLASALVQQAKREHASLIRRRTLDCAMRERLRNGCLQSELGTCGMLVPLLTMRI